MLISERHHQYHYLRLISTKDRLDAALLKSLEEATSLVADHFKQVPSFLLVFVLNFVILFQFYNANQNGFSTWRNFGPSTLRVFHSLASTRPTSFSSRRETQTFSTTLLSLSTSQRDARYAILSLEYVTPIVYSYPGFSLTTFDHLGCGDHLGNPAVPKPAVLPLSLSEAQAVH